MTGLDLSAALLAAAAERQPEPTTVRFVRADFCRLPLAKRSCHLVVAAFCPVPLRRPGQVIAEIGRCLRPSGTAILATKSADSCRELDQIVATAGLVDAVLASLGLSPGHGQSLIV